MVARYASIIAQRTDGDAQVVREHFTDLIGEEQAAALGIKLGKLQLADLPTASGGTTVGLTLITQDAVAIAGYLASPEHLNLGNLPPNPFGSPELADLMNQLKVLNGMARTAPDNPYSLSSGPTAHQLQHEIAKLASVVVNKFSREMLDNGAREEALKAMRLDDCLEIYTPGVVGPSSIVPGTPGEPTRYRARADSLQVASRLLNFYDS